MKALLKELKEENNRKCQQKNSLTSKVILNFTPPQEYQTVPIQVSKVTSQLYT